MNLRLCVVLAIFVTVFAEDDQCTTPDGKTGTCVPLFTCEAVLKAVPSKSNAIRDFAKKSICSSDVDTLVCCESPSSVNLNDYDASVLPVTCGVERETPKIYGGTVTEIDEFPWVAVVNYKSKVPPYEDAGYKCAGSVISSRYVLTAATCVVSREYEPSSVWVGDWQLSTDPDCVGLPTNKECAAPVQKLKVKDIIPHLFYSRRSAFNNIALLRLEEEIKFNEFVRPICLPTPNVKSPEVGSRLVAAGWGATEDGQSSDYKLKVDLPLVGNDVCAEKYQNTRNKITSHEICAGGEEGKDTCQGDSGAPLMRTYQEDPNSLRRWYQEGISSFGVGCGLAGHPAVYTRVSDYMQWITTVMSQE